MSLTCKDTSTKQTRSAISSISAILSLDNTYRTLSDPSLITKFLKLSRMTKNIGLNFKLKMMKFLKLCLIQTCFQNFQLVFHLRFALNIAPIKILFQPLLTELAQPINDTVSISNCVYFDSINDVHVHSIHIESST